MDLIDHLHKVLLVVTHVETCVALHALKRGAPGRRAGRRAAQIGLEAVESRLVRQLGLGHGLFQVIRDQFHVENAPVDDIVAANLAEGLLQSVARHPVARLAHPELEHHHGHLGRVVGVLGLDQVNVRLGDVQALGQRDPVVAEEIANVRQPQIRLKRTRIG